jgi:hypothetical protein
MIVTRASFRSPRTAAKRVRACSGVRVRPSLATTRGAADSAATFRATRPSRSAWPNAFRNTVRMIRTLLVL